MFGGSCASLFLSKLSVVSEGGMWDESSKLILLLPRFLKQLDVSQAIVKLLKVFL